MAEVIFGAGYDDRGNVGALQNPDTTYAAAHDAAEADTVYDATSDFYVGQYYYSPSDRYTVYRGALEFDFFWSESGTWTAQSIVNAASIFLHVDNDYSDTDFDIVIVNGDDLANPFVAADYGDLLDEIVSLGEVSSAGIVEDEWIEIPLGATAIAAIQAQLRVDGVIRFGVRSSRDIAETTPKLNSGSADESVLFHGYEYGGSEYDAPYLLLEIEEPPIELPAVTTDPATSVESEQATLPGTLDDDGGESCNCGFEYGETDTYGTPTPTQSKVSGEAFSQPITGLDANKTYHFRAIATNSAGTSYSPDRSFTTLASAPAVTTDEATGRGAISATINGTLNQDGGEVCECGLEWGLDTGYGTTTPPQSKRTGETLSQVIGGLFPGTTYHFRAFATNSVGTSYGADESFATALVISRAYALAREEL